MRINSSIELTAGVIIVAFVLMFGGVWIYRYNHSVSWTTAQTVVQNYGIEHRLFKLPILNMSSQVHHRWNGVWLENYYFFETSDTTANAEHPSKDFTNGKLPPILEVTVSGETGKVVAEDISQYLKVSYPIHGFKNH
ncbi:hypothetical protein [Alicyclobacillus tolerans]|uniref:Uncharacterized protein n=1 Tax=Alicyclobacillus tolerans TaxID=90970 RepID=A0A1M6LMG5_9BACL|nr:hypothetical protein [Alicyclobacillus montanus]SHJ72399.1 hypothetical protein SAMN05443507_10321 [Alicyclobacillus montanus]